jgi:hypothetical protein
MWRSSVMALAALLLAAAITFVPAKAFAGSYFGGGWYDGLRWDYYGGRFLVSNTHLHEYAAFNPNCAWLRRLVPTPLGPQWQLVPVCF